MSDRLHDAVRRALMFQDGAPISDEDRFMGDLGADSLAGIELVMEVEAAFGVEIPDEHLYDIVTVGDLREAVEKARE